MTKDVKKRILISALLAAVLFVPIPSGVYEDGGTQTYTALTYKIVDWNRMTATSVYDKTRVYFIPRNFKSIDDLWVYEEGHAENIFTATVLQVTESAVLVQPAEGSAESYSSDQISFATKELETIPVCEGSIVRIAYTGGIMESYPAQIRAVRWELVQY